MDRIDKIKEAAFPVLVAPFNGSKVSVQVRCLNYVQISSCGDFSIIDIQNEEKKADIADVIKLVNYQENLLRETLVSPTYDEIVEMYYGHDSWVLDKKEKIKSLKETIKSGGLSIEDQAELNEEINALEMQSGFLLPGDFTSFVVSWALGVDRSDIKKVNRKMLLSAAVLATRGNNNPCDHLTGDFTDYHKDQINSAAWLVYDEYVEEQQIEREAKKKGFSIIRPKRGD